MRGNRAYKYVFARVISVKVSMTKKTLGARARGGKKKSPRGRDESPAHQDSSQGEKHVILCCNSQNVMTSEIVHNYTNIYFSNFSTKIIN